jgi:hypothetical protein
VLVVFSGSILLIEKVINTCDVLVITELEALFGEMARNKSFISSYVYKWINILTCTAELCPIF